MYKVLQYYGKYRSVRGGLDSLPGWCRIVLTLAALPGILLIGLSILAFAVSVLVLLLLTGPLYRVLRALTGTGAGGEQHAFQPEAEAADDQEFTPADEPPVDVAASVVSDEAVVNEPPRPRRQIDVKIIE